ncbi:MAG TPA: 4'-phosphopantetheinyl transferase superfamily protein [Mucilaginibacter sp.]|nr:4'-phosphopantetheinyl transferase superfamily protein [Mucilaginibacter sp.]
MEVLRKRQWTDRQLGVAGKLLILEVMKNLGFQHESVLSKLKYNRYSRPHIDEGADFNIAHSGNVAICCGTDTGMIGCDIEKIQEITLEDYIDHFTTNEWNQINSRPNVFEGFYEFWTRKEAVLKAIGTGFHTLLSLIDVTGDHIIYDDTDYYIHLLNIDKKYKCHVATTIKQDDIMIIPVKL